MRALLIVFCVFAFAAPAAAQNATPADPAPAVRTDQSPDFDLNDAARSVEGGGQARALRPGEDPVEARIRWLAREHLKQCWEMPTGPSAERLVVTVQFSLNEDGTLRGQPQITSPRNYIFDAEMRDAASNALSAVRACAPYPFANDPVVAEHYDKWDELEFAFRPAR